MENATPIGRNMTGARVKHPTSANAQERTKLNVQDFLDAQRFRGFHWIVFIMCFFVVAMDGFDTSVMGYITPGLLQDWKVPREALGPVLSAALIGLGIGAVVAGPIADRIGRKAVMIVSVFFFGAWSVASAHTTSLTALTMFRFLTGLGLGASMPNAVALMSEYAPKRIRGVAVNTMFTGYTLAAALCGLIAAYLIPRFGWQSVLLTGGIIPIVISVVLIPFLPESLKFLVARNRSAEKTAALLGRIAPGMELHGVRLVSEESESVIKRNPVATLFSSQYRLGTLMLWLGYFMFLSVFYMLTNWTPTLFKASGMSLHESVLIGSLIHFGGTFGLLAAGFLMDRFKPAYVIASFAALTGLVLVIIGHSLGSPVWFIGSLIFVSGICLSAGVGSMPPFAADFYPTASRVTGTSWVLAIGRFGAVGGAWGGAVLSGLGWKFGDIYSLLAIPLLFAALSLVVMGKQRAPA
jgi:AAHS family 4-hydroxybenzoate transporter-like MFS transporter